MRFALSTAGLATVALAGTANGAVIDMTHSLDRWAGEHSWQVHDSNMSTVASMFVSGGQLYYGGVSNLSYVSDTDPDIFGTITGTLDLANGTYHVAMQDAYSDGWAWGTYVGGLAIGTGSASFPSSMAGSQSFTFTVVPAPGAMALLGLAGLAARRRRRA
jgi:uncharacterized protein (TIGR03382 family)